jgi:hypothetical protein
MITINKFTIKGHLVYLFAIYQDRVEQFPELTLEAQMPNIETMKGYAKYANELKELKVTLKYLLEEKDDTIVNEFVSNWDDDFEVHEIKQVLKFALQTDWNEIGTLPNDIYKHITFVN